MAQRKSDEPAMRGQAVVVGACRRDQPADYLTRLRDFTASLTQLTTPAEISSLVVGEVAAVTGALYAALALRSADTGDLVFSSTSAGNPAYPPEILASVMREAGDSRALLGPRAGAVGGPALAAVPLLLRGRTVGSIGLVVPQDGRQWHESECVFLQTLGDQCALALERARLYDVERETLARAEAELRERLRAEEATRKRAEEIGLLYEAGRLLGSTLDIETIYDTMRALIARIMDCDGLLLSTYSADDRLIRCAYAWVEGSRVDSSVFPPVPLAPEGRGMQSAVIHTGEPLLISDLQERRKTSVTTYDVDPDGKVHEKPDTSKPPTRSGILVPLKLEGQVVGVLQVQSLRPDAYSQDDLRMLEALMLQVSAASRNAYLYQQARTEIAERLRAEAELERKQADIEALNERLQRAMRETHHRVKNNLQVICSLVDMQVLQGAEMVSIAEIQRLGQHARGLAAIHELLTHETRDEGATPTLSAQAALEKLVPMLRSTAGGRAIRCAADDVRLPIRQATAMSVLVNELVSNAVKHGAGEIALRFTAREQTACLEVTDEGSGFAPGFDLKRSASTGLELVEQVSRWDLNGSARYQTRPEGGARVTVMFPIGDVGVYPPGN